MNEKPYIVAVNREHGFAVTSRNEVIPITSWYNRDGETQDRFDAVSAVAGPDSLGKWFSINLTLYAPVTYH